MSWHGFDPVRSHGVMSNRDVTHHCGIKEHGKLVGELAEGAFLDIPFDSFEFNFRVSGIHCVGAFFGKKLMNLTEDISSRA